MARQAATKHTSLPNRSVLQKPRAVCDGVTPSGARYLPILRTRTRTAVCPARLGSCIRNRATAVRLRGCAARPGPCPPAIYTPRSLPAEFSSETYSAL